MLIRAGVPIFPTHLIIEALAEEAGQGAYDRQALAAILSWGDTLVAAFYQIWAGLVPGPDNALGFDPAARNLQRTGPFLDWIATRLTPEHPGAPEIALACILLWTDARRPIPWRGHAEIDNMVSQMRTWRSFRNTAPSAWEPC